MKSFTFTQEKYNCKVFLLGKLQCPCVYCITEEESANQLAEALVGQDIALVTISGVNWEGELSPWLAPRAFSGGKDFSGGADELIHRIEQELLPAAESRLGFTPTYRVAAGYSLAGLFSLYTPYRTALFQRIACASGSLWYDHFLDFMRDNQMIQLPDRVYFSLGIRKN
jgi:predicted alpha/beta superfamily hydrolase